MLCTPNRLEPRVEMSRGIDQQSQGVAAEQWCTCYWLKACSANRRRDFAEDGMVADMQPVYQSRCVQTAIWTNGYQGHPEERYLRPSGTAAMEAPFRVSGRGLGHLLLAVWGQEPPALPGYGMIEFTDMNRAAFHGFTASALIALKRGIVLPKSFEALPSPRRAGTRRRVAENRKCLCPRLCRRWPSIHRASTQQTRRIAAARRWW